MDSPTGSPSSGEVSACHPSLPFVNDLPLSWIEESLNATERASERTRRLPATSVMSLLVAMGIFRDRSITDVANDLGLVRSKPGEGPIRSNAISAARTRLGEAPVAHLARRCGTQWATEAANAQRWRGLAVYGLDGSTLRAADTPENREFFGGQGAGSHRPHSGYPLVRIVVLVALRSHLVAALAVDSYARTSEMSLTPALLEQVPDQSVVILDRNFLGARLLLNHARKGILRHWLLRARSTTRWRVVQTFAPGDQLVEMEVSAEARRRDPSLPSTWRARAIRYQRRGFRPQTLLTSLLDPMRWPARELIGLYHERWECELGLDELKTEQLDREETLRSKAPWSVRQEVWGVMIGYNLLRRRAAASGRAQDVSPLRISFVVMLRQLRDHWVIVAIVGPQVLPQLQAHAHRQRVRARLPSRRPERQYPRAVKLKMSNYDRKLPVVRSA